MDFIQDKMDFRQYGGSKGHSITHYLIEFINFILLHQDSTDQNAILAVMVDFNKAFNRQDHNLLITKLSDMGVPAWLLRVVMAFLSDRRMVVRYKGEQSSVKELPGGGPQGTRQVEAPKAPCWDCFSFWYSLMMLGLRVNLIMLGTLSQVEGT